MQLMGTKVLQCSKVLLRKKKRGLLANGNNLELQRSKMHKLHLQNKYSHWQETSNGALSSMDYMNQPFGIRKPLSVKTCAKYK